MATAPRGGLGPASNRLSALFRTVHKKRERDISMLAVASPICASACRHRRADAGGVRRRNYQPQHFGDAPMLPELLDQIPSDREIASVTADGASDTRKGHDAIAGRGADAVIPIRKNAKPWTPDTVGARARNDILRATKHLGRARWRRGNGCHRRSRAETKMNCFKLLGQRLMARDFDRQVPKSRSVSPASIVTRHLQFPSPSPLHKSPRGRRSSNPNAYSCNSAPDDPVALAAEPLRRRLADSGDRSRYNHRLAQD